MCGAMMNKLILAILFLLPSICQADITTGLVGWWKYDDANGVNPIDSSTGGHSGTLTGTTKPSAITGKVQGALSFDGSTGYVDYGNNFTLATSGADYSFSAWIYLYVNPTNGVSFSIVKKATGANAWEFLFDIVGFGNNTTPRTDFQMWSTNNPDALGATTLKLNTWYHVVAVRTTSDTSMRVYLNGVQDGSTTTNTTGDYSITASTEVGRGNITFTGFFNGRIDDVRIYNRALTKADIIQLYNQGLYGNKINNATIQNAVLN